MLSVLFSGTIGSFPDPRHEALSDIGSLFLSVSLLPKGRFVPAFSHSGDFQKTGNVLLSPESKIRVSTISDISLSAESDFIIEL